MAKEFLILFTGAAVPLYTWSEVIAMIFSFSYYETPDLVFIVTDVTVLHLKADIFMHTK